MVMDTFSLRGRVALVTGCRRGLGLAIAQALAEAGADVFGVATGDMQACRAAVEGAGRAFGCLQADLGDPAAPEAAVAGCLARFGALHILVNNAGITRRDDALCMSEADFDAVMDVNLRAVFLLSQRAAHHMKDAGGGKILNLASMLSFQGGIRCVSYTASKSAVLGMTRALANEWARYGINVNAIAPGYMDTDLTAAVLQDPARAPSLMDRIPAGRWGAPQDLAGAAVFLCSDAAAYVHGFTLAVDGGWLAR